MPTDEQYREQAQSEWVGPDDTFSVDPTAQVDRTMKGAWVQIWVYVSNEDIPNQGQFGVGA